MIAASTGWRIASLLGMLLAAVGPIYATYDIYGRGPTAEKRVELRRLPTIDPLKDLSALGDKVSLSLRVEDQIINNIVVVQAMLRNAGTSPIVPSEYHENLGVTVSKPRHIVAVENSSKYFPDAVQLRWRRISETKFEADPALLNPSDIVSTSVYLTNAKSGVYETDKAPEIDVKWKARITNLRGFYEPPDPLERMKERYFGIHVELQGWALPFTVICALLFQAVHLRLLSRAGFLRDWSGYSIGVILCASLLSFAAAESSATYIFGSNLTDLMGINHWLNLPPILANIVALIYFDRQARTRTDFAPKAS